MMIKYINPLTQLGVSNYDLIIEDDVIGNYRFSRQFPEGVTDAELASEAQRTVDQIITDLTAQAQEAVGNVQIDKPEDNDGK